ncbi:MAG: DUF2249 domain-containing protein [Bacteroidetes bacterium]|nr:DUF2249 domain-containing protein [Bacteroidota bacterium]MBS1649538.1 DUF2249 domain-containing protein [Bacteroidota bacterium]
MPIEINANTKIATILKANPNALEAIISISPKFSKLRNPLLRKIMAARTSIHTASKVANCNITDFYKVLQPLGFTINETIVAENESPTQIVLPNFMQQINNLKVDVLDVRPIIEGGEDPFKIIMKKIKELPNQTVLKLINTFEPTPLINILSKQGFEYFIEKENEDLINSFFYKKNTTQKIEETKPAASNDWNETIKQFENNLLVIDVRHLEMPQPMMTILEALEKLPNNTALFVYHKRIPVFLLPELKERNMDYRVKEIKDNEVHLLIFHAKN